MDGLSAATVTQWEKDEYIPWSDNANKLVNVLDTTWAYLRHGTITTNEAHSSSTGANQLTILNCLFILAKTHFWPSLANSNQRIWHSPQCHLKAIHSAW